METYAQVPFLPPTGPMPMRHGFRNPEASSAARSLGPKGRRPYWTPEEDAQLVALVQKYGTKNWGQIAKELKSSVSRKGKSCRSRWIHQLDPGIRKGPFTREEERIIIQKQADYGNKWARIARFLPGRTDNAVKNHWHGHLKRRVLGAAARNDPDEDDDSDSADGDDEYDPYEDYEDYPFAYDCEYGYEYGGENCVQHMIDLSPENGHDLPYIVGRGHHSLNGSMMNVEYPAAPEDVDEEFDWGPIVQGHGIGPGDENEGAVPELLLNGHAILSAKRQSEEKTEETPNGSGSPMHSPAGSDQPNTEQQNAMHDEPLDNGMHEIEQSQDDAHEANDDNTMPNQREMSDRGLRNGVEPGCDANANRKETSGGNEGTVQNGSETGPDSGKISGPVVMAGGLNGAVIENGGSLDSQEVHPENEENDEMDVDGDQQRESQGEEDEPCEIGNKDIPLKTASGSGTTSSDEPVPSLDIPGDTTVEDVEPMQALVAASTLASNLTASNNNGQNNLNERVNGGYPTSFELHQKQSGPLPPPQSGRSSKTLQTQQVMYNGRLREVVTVKPTYEPVNGFSREDLENGLALSGPVIRSPPRCGPYQTTEDQHVVEKPVQNGGGVRDRKGWGRRQQTGGLDRARVYNGSKRGCARKGLQDYGGGGGGSGDFASDPRHSASVLEKAGGGRLHRIIQTTGNGIAGFEKEAGIVPVKGPTTIEPVSSSEHLIHSTTGLTSGPKSPRGQKRPAPLDTPPSDILEENIEPAGNLGVVTGRALVPQNPAGLHGCRQEPCVNQEIDHGTPSLLHEVLTAHSNGEFRISSAVGEVIKKWGKDHPDMVFDPYAPTHPKRFLEDMLYQTALRRQQMQDARMETMQVASGGMNGKGQGSKTRRKVRPPTRLTPATEAAFSKQTQSSGGGAKNGDRVQEPARKYQRHARKPKRRARTDVSEDTGSIDRVSDEVTSPQARRSRPVAQTQGTATHSRASFSGGWRSERNQFLDNGTGCDGGYQDVDETFSQGRYSNEYGMSGDEGLDQGMTGNDSQGNIGNRDSPPVTTSRTRRAIRKPQRLIEQIMEKKSKPRTVRKKPQQAVPETASEEVEEHEDDLLGPVAGILGYKLNPDGSVSGPPPLGVGAKYHRMILPASFTSQSTAKALPEGARIVKITEGANGKVHRQTIIKGTIPTPECGNVRCATPSGSLKDGVDNEEGGGVVALTDEIANRAGVPLLMPPSPPASKQLPVETESVQQPRGVSQRLSQYQAMPSALPGRQRGESGVQKRTVVGHRNQTRVSGPSTGQNSVFAGCQTGHSQPDPQAMHQHQHHPARGGSVQRTGSLKEVISRASAMAQQQQRTKQTPPHSFHHSQMGHHIQSAPDAGPSRQPPSFHRAQPSGLQGRRILHSMDTSSCLRPSEEFGAQQMPDTATNGHAT